MAPPVLPHPKKNSTVIKYVRRRGLGWPLARVIPGPFLTYILGAMAPSPIHAPTQLIWPPSMVPFSGNFVFKCGDIAQFYAYRLGESTKLLHSVKKISIVRKGSICGTRLHVRTPNFSKIFKVDADLFVFLVPKNT